jgi:sulfate adenylyltransferase
MSKLVPPHGGGDLKPLLLTGDELEKEKEKANGLKKVEMSSRETGDLIMLGIGGFTPLKAL